MKKNEFEPISRRHFFRQSASGLLPFIALVTSGRLLDACTAPLVIEDGTPSGGGGTNPATVDTVSKASGSAGGYQYVDMGLSVKWGRMNMGANSSPSQSGTYYDALYTSASGNATPSAYGLKKGDDIAGTVFDIAHVKLGNGWRLPTNKEYTELVDNCTIKEFNLNGVDGLLLVSKKNGNSLFFPFAGERSWSSYQKKYELEGVGKWGEYLAGTLAALNDQSLTFIIDKKMDVNGAGSWSSDEYTARAVYSGSGGSGSTGCNNSCANNSTASSCHGCGQSCSGSCTNTCSILCAGRCTTTCGGTCSYVSAGSSCSGCATGCYNACYRSCSTLCYTTCSNDCINSSY